MCGSRDLLDNLSRHDYNGLVEWPEENAVSWKATINQILYWEQERGEGRDESHT